MRKQISIGKPVVVIYCFADFRYDRCPAKIAGNEHTTDVSACSGCEFSEFKHFKRGLAVSEIGKKELQEPKRWKNTAEVTTTEGT